MTDVFLVGFGVLALVFATLVVLLRQPMRAACALIAHMVCLAGIFVCLAVHVVALFQVLIYVGAVMVFMVYTIMLLDDRDRAYRRRFSRLLWPGTVVGLVFVVALVGLVGSALPGMVSAPAATEAASFGFRAFSVAFMQHYWFHFELATVLLLVGIVAAWTVLREHR